ncbi:adhesion G-protein coupled receptor G6-like isoform X2 [Stegodyphus dumicola]|uniref:adhesion G-protein coupled receptor G6-like isoform X2 n=1 Tax=Stegodyphus dumicola TaxID=202533 RepID=UPI0015B2D756|nr:adhesion G-protein coupled receptor G6-like isoform X2 [Stegodyphus dumicola]
MSSHQCIYGAIYAIIICYVLLECFQETSATEVTESSSIVNNSTGTDILLPLLTCHAKYTGYKEVRWYKDYLLIKNGSSNLSGHTLSLDTLLGTKFEHPLKLQGYYWCETDYDKKSNIHPYLFRIKGVNTYVGGILATEDSLDSENELSEKLKRLSKQEEYEQEMQNILFAFLPLPNTYVTDVRPKEKGLEVRFYLYVRQVLVPRGHSENELVEDRNQLEYVEDYLNNETVTDEQLYTQILEWTAFRGIDIKKIVLRSTLGCYEEASLVPAEPPVEIHWPFARIGEIVIPDESCSLESGLAATRTCTGSFYRGATWGSPSGKCNVPPSNLTLEIKNLYDRYGAEDKSKYLAKLKDLAQSPQELSITDMHIVLNILKKLAVEPELYQKDLNSMFSVIDTLAEANTTELMAAKNTIQLTYRLLNIIDKVMRLATEENKEIIISKKHLLVDTKNTKLTNKEDHVIGISVLSSKKGKSLKDGSIEFLLNGTKYPQRESIAYFLLPPELVLKRESDLLLPCQINMVFFKEWILFPEPKGILLKRNYRILPTPVMYAALSGGPAWNLSEPVQIFFRKMYNEKIENPVCVHFDPLIGDNEGGWSTEGCEFGGLKNGFYNCRCHHLSIFAVILSKRPDSMPYKLGTSIYVGCGVSILALSMVVVLYIISKVWRCTVDHSILFCMSLSFLCFLILLFISEMRFLWKSSCLLLGLLSHYMILVTFSWLLVQAILYRLRFAKKTDVAEIPHFIAKSALFAWVMSWLFGFFALHQRTQELRILFSISITLTAYYVTLFFIFHEISFWDMCRNLKRRNKSPSDVVSYDAKYYKSTEDQKNKE